MVKKKKLTRKQKILMTKKGICWKCSQEISFDKTLNAFKCKNCGTIIEVIK